MNKSVSVSYYAILREQRGLGTEEVPTMAVTASDLYEELRARHGFTLPASRVRVAVNDDFQPWGVAVEDGDRIAFLPPVAGG